MILDLKEDYAKTIVTVGNDMYKAETLADLKFQAETISFVIKTLLKEIENEECNNMIEKLLKED